MTKAFNDSEIQSQIDLPGGDRIILLDRLGKIDQYSKDETSRNVFRIDSENQMQWQVYSQFDTRGDPFTRIYLKNGLSGYRWDGGIYNIDLDTGEATPLLLEK